MNAKRIYSGLLGLFILFGADTNTMANVVNDVRQSAPVKQVFCPTAQWFINNKAFSTTTSVISTSFKSVDIVLSSIIGYEAERKKLDQGLTGTATIMERLKPFFVGPLKAFGRTMAPFVSGASKVVKQAELDSRVATFYMKKFKPVKSYTWKPVSYALKGVQAASLLLCKVATYKGITIQEKSLVAAGKKFAEVTPKYAAKVAAAIKRLDQIDQLLRPIASKLAVLEKGLSPIASVATNLTKGIKVMNKAMSPVFVGVKKLSGLLDKQNCVTYMAKVKVKVKNGKLWKMKVKTKKMKYCFKFKNIIGKIQKLSDTVQKPVNQLFNKTIKPVIDQITKAVSKGLKLDSLNKQAQKLLAIQGPIDTFATKVKAQVGNLGKDLTLFQTITRDLNSIRAR